MNKIDAEYYLWSFCIIIVERSDVWCDPFSSTVASVIWHQFFSVMEEHVATVACCMCVYVYGMNSVGRRLHLSHHGVLWRWRLVEIHSATKDLAAERCQTAASAARYQHRIVCSHLVWCHTWWLHRATFTLASNSQTCVTWRVAKLHNSFPE